MTSWTPRKIAGASGALIAAGTLSLVSLGLPAHAATPQVARAHLADSLRSSTHKFTYVTAGTELGGKASRQAALFHGAIDGGGRDVPRGQTDVVHLAGGTITVKHPGSESKYVPKIDKATCYSTFKITGRFTLVHGTGTYRGTTGSGTYVGHGYGYLARTKSGSCNPKAAPASEVFQILAKGTLG